MEVRSATVGIPAPAPAPTIASPRATLASHSCRKAPLPVFTSSTSPSRGFSAIFLLMIELAMSGSDSVLPACCSQQQKWCVCVCLCVCV